MLFTEKVYLIVLKDFTFIILSLTSQKTYKIVWKPSTSCYGASCIAVLLCEGGEGEYDEIIEGSFHKINSCLLFGDFYMTQGIK